MRVLIFIFLMAALSFEANALAVVSDFLPNNTLTLTEGESAIYSIRLQNTESYEAAYKVDYDLNFLKPIGYKEQYIVEPKSSYRIEFNVTAPSYDHKNEENNLFVIGYTVHQLTSPSGGGIPFLTKINKNFKLKVAKRPSKTSSDLARAGLVIAAIIAAYSLFAWVRKGKTDKKGTNKQKINKQKGR